ncbi:MAG: tetratricopeptide repeat protein [Pirellulaceae bacterium]
MIHRLYLGVLVALLLGSFAAAQEKDGKAQNDADTRKTLAYFANAADFQNSGKFELAIDEWKKLVDEYPKSSQASTAWHHLGVCNLQRKEPDYAAAIAAFSKALQDEKLEIREESLINLSWAEFTQARLEAAGSAKQKAGLEKAREHMTEFLKKYSDGAYADQALFYLGDIEHLLGDRSRSMAYYKKLLETPALAKSNLRADAMYALAVGYEEEKKLREANRHYQDFLNEFPKHRLAGEIRLRMADLLLSDNKPAEAEKLLAAISTDQESSMADYALLRLGYAYEQQGKAEQAVAQYQQLLEKFPESKHVPAAALSVGQSLFSAGKYDEAAAQFRRVFEAGGEQAPDAAHWMAVTLLRQNKPAEVLPAIQKAIKQAGKSPIAVALKMDYADALYAMPEKVEEALAAYEAIANDHADDPLAPRAAYNAAFAALQLGKVADAGRRAELFLSRYPQDPLRNEVAYVAAEALLRQGEHEAAAAAYAKLISADPKNPSYELWNLRLGMANYLAGKYPQAIEQLAPLVEKFKLDTQKAEAQFIIGASYLYQEQLDKAIQWLTASHQSSGQWGSADENLVMLADAHQRNKDNAAARKTLEMLLEKYPRTRFKAQIEYKLSQLSAAAGRYDEAIQGYRALANNPEAASYHNFANYGIAWCLMQQDNYESALQQLQPLVAQNLRDSIGSEAKLAEGVCLRKLGKVDASIDSLNQFLATKPTSTSLANGLYEIGLAYTEKSDLDQATKHFARIQREVPNYPAMDKVLYELAWNFQESAKPDEAAKYFELLATKYPQSEFAAEATYMQAEKLYDAKQYGNAAATYTSVMSSTKDPEMLEKASYKLGWSLFQQEKYPQAAQQFEQQARNYPSGPLTVDALFMHAECAFKQEQYQPALASYQLARQSLEASSVKSAASEQVRTLIYLHAGQCCRELKDWDQCETWLKVVIDRYPKSPFLPTALYELGFCKQNQNKLPEALAHYAEVAGEYRTEVAARARFMMGEVYFSQRDFVKAIPEFQRVMFGFGGDKAPEEIKNWQAKSAFEAARCSEVLIENLKGTARAKVVETAQEFYEFIVQKHAKHELAAKAQSRLGELQKLR